MLWLWFDTPSTKDFKKYTDYFLEKSEENYKQIILQDVLDWDNDFLKLIVNTSWETLWILNKYNFNYLLIDTDIEIETKLQKIISFKKKIIWK